MIRLNLQLTTMQYLRVWFNYTYSDVMIIVRIDGRHRMEGLPAFSTAHTAHTSPDIMAVAINP